METKLAGNRMLVYLAEHFMLGKLNGIPLALFENQATHHSWGHWNTGIALPLGFHFSMVERLVTRQRFILD